MRMQTDDDHDNSDKEEGNHSVPFTLLHTRRFASNSNVLRLCPSMDLLFVVTTTASSASLTLYRSVTFQKLVTLTVNEDAAVTLDDSMNNSTANASQFTHAAWRPDGRWLACANHQGQIVLQDLEAILSSSSPVVVTSMNRQDASSSTTTLLPHHQQQQFTSLAFLSGKTTKLRALVWNHMGKSHPSWSTMECEEEEEEESSPYWELYPSPSRFDLGNREALYLPYRNIQMKRKTTNDFDNIVSSSTLPTSQTPLSILIAISQEESTGVFHLHACLHGCYPVLTNIPIPSGPSSSFPAVSRPEADGVHHRDAMVVTSTNLTQVAVCVPFRTNVITLYSIPSMQQHRYALQTISALYASTTSRMHRLREALPDIVGSWKSSLKPLDIKVQGLVRLLENYGLLEQTTLRQLLVQYILSGHTRAAPNLSNAMDQFFTGVQMNDQLIQRLEGSLVVAVANVESQCREHLLEPAQACVYQFSTLHGLARQVEADPLRGSDDEEDAVMVLSAKHSLCCLQRAELLLLTVEKTLVQLMEARIRLQDWVAWLRAVGAQIKARGTAPQSARHENARKRRVPDAVVKRLLQYLSESSDEMSDSNSTTESILHFEFAHLLQENASEESATGIITLPQCFTAIQNAAAALFTGPAQFITQQMEITQLFFGDHTSSQPVAMIIRMGRGNAVVEVEGFYCPSPTASRFRQWLMVARTSADDKSCLDLFAIPMSWNGTNSVASSHTWTARLQLHGCDELLALEFYSDDGKSTLSGDSNGKEGSRQSLAVLMRVGEDVQLSRIPYDAVELTMQSLQPKESSWVLPQPMSTIQVLFEGSSSDHDDEGERIIYARSRTVSSWTGRANLVLSGSRGMAAVECSQDSQGVVWNLFDLEEDEEEVDDESLDV